MANPNQNHRPFTEDHARKLICTNLATLYQQGSCTVRVRRLNGENRLTFQAEMQNIWKPFPEMDCHEHIAQEVMQALLAVGNKRNKDMHIAIQSSGNHDDVTIGIHKEAVNQHQNNLYRFVYGQLFWD